jgi:hypothetical protein
MDPATDIPACASQSECFAFHIDTRLTSSGATTGAGTSFSIPISGRVGNTDNNYDWIIDWGDSSVAEIVSGVSGITNTTSDGIIHDYAATNGAGEYQITIRPNGTATTGWFNAFGFYNNTFGANIDTNKYIFRSIDTPLTDLMRTKGAIYRFVCIFYGTRNGLGIPTGLFDNITTTGDINLSYMFYQTFYQYAYNSTTATIPAGLFDSIDTSKATNLSDMFYATFSYYAFYNSTTATIPAGLFDSIDTSNATNLSYMFYATFNLYAYNSTIGSIPAGLFDSIDTSNATNLSSMFYQTFYQYAYNSTIGSIPAGLFDSINTVKATSLSRMFNSTFQSYARNSTTTVVIPSGLFDSINTSKATNLTSMFYYTFHDHAYNSTTGTIPAGLFDSIDTSKATELSSMFYGTFALLANQSTVGTIPAGLFDSIDTSRAISLSNMFNNTFRDYATGSMNGTVPADLFNSINTSNATKVADRASIFNNTFSNYARRQAKFMVKGSVIATSSTFANPYLVKIGTDGTPSSNPTLVAGDKVYPTYNSDIRSIDAPSGSDSDGVAYASYQWSYTDGSFCAAPTPTSGCGSQVAKYTGPWPNTTEWTPTTSTALGNITFYDIVDIVLNFTLDSDNIIIGGSSGITPSSGGVFASASNAVIVATNNPTGYNLQLSTNQTNTSDLAHQSIAGAYLPVTANICTWDDTTKTFVNTSNILVANTYGFAIDSANFSAQKLCQVPNLNSPLTVKSTTTPSEPWDNTVFYYGVKINLEQVAGDYKTGIVYSVMVNL